MSDNSPTSADPLTQPSVANAGFSAGAVLRNARESAGVHIGAMAVALKVPVKKLEALEADRLDLLPDAVFARALASSVCRTLKLDPAHVLQLLPGQATPRLHPGIKISTASFDRPGMNWRVPLFSRMPKGVVMTASVLVVGAFALLFMPSLDRLKAKFSGTPADARDAIGTGSSPSASVEPTPVAISQAGSPVPGVAPANLPVASVPAASVSDAGSPRSSVADAQPAAGLVVFKTRGQSWVEVTDATGVVQLRKTMASGESASASGTLPLSVTIGRADSTEVLVRGKSVDLVSLSKDNVARFQVK